MKYRIYMEGLGTIPEGWYGGTPHSTNAPLYMRVSSKEEAYTLSKYEVVHTVTRFRHSGYPCRAVPPIVVTY